MTELLVTTELHPDGSAGGLEIFETSARTARDLRGRGVRQMGPAARGGGPSRTARLSLAESSATPEQRAELALAENPRLAALCGPDARPDESMSGQSEDAILDQLAERVAARLDDRSKPAPQLSDVDDVLPADAPPWFRAMFERPAA
jgi:hypothetical protein